MPTFIEQLAEQHLGGPLPADFIELTRPLDKASDEGQQWMRRAFRAMEQAGFRASDFSGQLAFALPILPNTLPGAWLGSPPAITQPGRHRRIDDFIEHNPYRMPVDDDVFIDIGAGFPPVTTLDTASRFPELRVLGVDPAIGHYIVTDAAGDYASFDRTGTLQFCYSEHPTPERIMALQRDAQGVRERFAALRDRLVPLLPPGGGPAEASQDGARIVRAPVAGYTTTRLTFAEAKIGDAGLPAADYIRCMNVLAYFDADFGDRARAWFGSQLRANGLVLHGRNAPTGWFEQYTVWQREGDVLVPREFALSPLNLRTLATITWWTLHDDDREVDQQCAVLRALWSANAPFRDQFDAALDRELAAHDYCGRRADGFLGGPVVGRSVDELRTTWQAIEANLDADGWVDRAVETLTRSTGKRAWRNAIGHLAVDPVEWGWDPIDLE